MNCKHYTEQLWTGAACVKHTLAIKVFGKYLIITWVWTA